MNPETTFPNGPLLSSFLDDLLAMFEVNQPEGLTLDPELCGLFVVALAEARDKAEVLERFAAAYVQPADHRRTPAESRALAAATASIGNVAVFPLTNRIVEDNRRRTPEEWEALKQAASTGTEVSLPIPYSPMLKTPDERGTK